MDMMVDFPGDARVDAHFGPFCVRTDQPSPAGGEGSAPSPFDLFLASLATCAGYYVLDFCRRRNIKTDAIRLTQHVRLDPTTKVADRISVEIQLPADFPEKYKAAVVRAAEQCKVKRHLENPPTLEVKACMGEAVTA